MKPKFADTMIGAKDYQALVDFYKELGSFEITESSDLYTLLKDRETNQVLCICNGSPMDRTGPGWQTEDFEGSKKHLLGLGATLGFEGGNPDSGFQFATFTDPEGNPLLLWAGSH